MKFFATVFLIALFASSLAVTAQTHDAKTEAIINKLKISTSTLNASAQGRECWLAVPLNEGKTQPTLNLEFYVTSSHNTTITLEVPGSGFAVTKKIKALEVATFTTKNATANFDWEIVSSQTPDNRGIHIFADKPISVYEVHLGSWKKREGGVHGWMNYRDIAHELVLVRLIHLKMIYLQKKRHVDGQYSMTYFVKQ